MALPLLFMSDLRVPGAVAIGMPFVCGCAWGRYVGGAPWRTGIAMVITGAIIQAQIIALGDWLHPVGPLGAGGADARLAR